MYFFQNRIFNFIVYNKTIFLYKLDPNSDFFVCRYNSPNHFIIASI